MTICVPAKRMYESMQNISGYDTSGLDANWLRACINECTKLEDRLPPEALDLQKLIPIAKLIGIQSVRHIVTPKIKLH